MNVKSETSNHALSPKGIKELQAELRHAHEAKKRLCGVDLRALSQVLEYAPEDMTVTVEAGLTLAALKKALQTHAQWLPLDPHGCETLTIADLLAYNRSGPRRLGYGTVRDYVIGLKAVLPDGRLIASGGKVVKNVAGYDLAKLFIGGGHSLGIVVEVTFKVRPMPEREQFLELQVDSLTEAGRWIETLSMSSLVPIVLDLHHLEPTGPMTLVIGFAGTATDVDWQVGEAARLGMATCREARVRRAPESSVSPDYEATPGARSNSPLRVGIGDLGYWDDFWSQTERVHRWSVLPSRLTDCLAGIAALPFIAHAGNGIVYVRGGGQPPRSPTTTALLHRLKETFDPHHILADLP